MILLADSERSDQTADAQAHLGLCCPHMPEDMFSHAANDSYIQRMTHPFTKPLPELDTSTLNRVFSQKAGFENEICKQVSMGSSFVHVCLCVCVFI